MCYRLQKFKMVGKTQKQRCRSFLSYMVINTRLISFNSPFCTQFLNVFYIWYASGSNPTCISYRRNSNWVCESPNAYLLYGYTLVISTQNRFCSEQSQTPRVLLVNQLGRYTGQKTEWENFRTSQIIKIAEHASSLFKINKNINWSDRSTKAEHHQTSELLTYIKRSRRLFVRQLC